MNTHFTSQQEALVEQIMTCLRGAGELNRNSEFWSESHTRRSQRQRSISPIERSDPRDMIRHSQDRTQSEVRSERTHRTEPHGVGTKQSE